MPPALRLRLLLAALVVTGFSPGARAVPAELTDCTLTGTQGLARAEARCGWLERPEDPSNLDSPTVRLRVAVIPALSRNPQPDAFTLINGGPGASSLDLYADAWTLFTAIRRERDIVLMDQRGTGESNPFDCPELETSTIEHSAELVRTATRECLDALPGNPRFYTTSVAIRDLEALRQVLGYPKLNIYAISYGTRVAQHYARRYPHAVRTLIIDGVVPPDEPLGPNAALNAERVMDRLIERCAADDVCAERFPSLKTRLASLRASLGRAPVPVALPDPVSGVAETVEITQNHLIMTLRMLSYAPETASLLPLVIDEAARGNWRPLAANAIRLEAELLGAMRIGMHNSVVCTEDIPFLGEIDLDALRATYMGTAQVESLQTICELWPHGVLDEDLRAPLEVDVPTLILSGTEDPITPPDFGERVHATLPASLHIVGEGQGHGMLGRGCVPQLINRFVEAGRLDKLDGSCIARLTAPPFFIDLLGPAP